MAFHFTCPYCYKKTLVDDLMAGQSGPCAGCGKQVTIPMDVPVKRPDHVQAVDDRYVQVSSPNSSRRITIWALQAFGWLALVAVLSSILVFLFWPAFQDVKQRRDVIASMNQLQKIARALNNYAMEHGSYPPAIIYDATGKPMHSWRVLLLKHLGYESLYQQYDLEEPWDSEKNSALLVDCPGVYISPFVGDALATETSYMLITGQGTLFPESAPLQPDQIGDGRGNTLLVVEVANLTHEWMKPKDIPYAKLNHKIGASGDNAIGGLHAEGAAGAFADGQGAWLPKDLDPILLDAIITPNGGEPVNPENFRLR